MNRSLPTVGLILGLLGLAAQPGLAAAPKLKQFLTRHCAECHDADMHKGGLRVDTLALPPAGADSLNLLVRLHDRVQAGEMPPEKAA